MKRFTSVLAIAISSILLPASVSAQVAPVFITGSTTQQQNQWYKYQQYLHDVQMVSTEYQQFQVAYTNYTKYHMGGLVQVITPLMNLQNTIESSLNNGTNPALAAEMKRNQFMLQNLSLVDTLNTMNSSAVGTSQMFQVMNAISATMAADTMQQHEVDYAKAQAAVQAANNSAALRTMSNQSSLTP